MVGDISGIVALVALAWLWPRGVEGSDSSLLEHETDTLWTRERCCKCCKCASTCIVGANSGLH